MYCIKSDSTDPYLNLATEEYLLKNSDKNIFMLWQNRPSVIIGRYQNTLSEINIDYVEKNNIDVVRRITGGGTVFHDLGNINFSFIARENKSKQYDFAYFTRPVIAFLKSIGIDARFEGRNDLTIDGKKFSGNAAIKYNGSILHHGTLLFASKMTDLTAALNVNKTKFEGKAVQSVSARVTNISEHLANPMNVSEFINDLFDFVVGTTSDSLEYQINLHDFASITKLKEEKYIQWWWNFGQSPAFNIRKEFKTKGGNFEVLIRIEKGMIAEIRIYGDYFTEDENNRAEQLLINTEFDKNAIQACFEKNKLEKFFFNVSTEEFVNGIFG